VQREKKQSRDWCRDNGPFLFLLFYKLHIEPFSLFPPPPFHPKELSFLHKYSLSPHSFVTDRMVHSNPFMPTVVFFFSFCALFWIRINIYIPAAGFRNLRLLSERGYIVKMWRLVGEGFECREGNLSDQ
jgi:hypothetical protein